jgi:phage terminase large subunit GpA-like protein
MLAVTEPGVKKITVMGPTQVLKTELINNIVGYFIDQDPAPMIVMQPTREMGEAWSKDRLDKMIRDTPVLSDKIKEKRSRESDNTLLHKSFPGGHVTIVGSNSPSSLASRPVRLVLCDEIDKYPASAGDEGDPVRLLEKRTETFWNSLSVRVCSPTIKGRSRIEAEYELGDKRVFHGLCPHCEEYDELKWENVHWDEKIGSSSAYYACGQCNSAWTEADRLKAISKGKYIASASFTGHASFKVNRIASPWKPVSDMVAEYLEVKDDPDTNKLKTFVNTTLAESFEEKGEVPEHKRLYERRELYTTNTLTNDVVFLTAGVDVQKDHLKCEIVGWARDKQSWSIDYRTLMGETATSVPWLELDKILNETWVTPDGRELQIRVMNVDSGFNTQHVYSWVKKHSPERVRAIKGSDSVEMTFASPKDVDISKNGQKLKRPTKVWPVGVSIIKHELYSWLNLDGAGDDGKYPAGFCHYPQYDEKFFESLCSEQLMKRVVNGRTVHRWVKIHERNEALDCRVYARAAAAMFGMDRFKVSDWDALERKNLPAPKYTETPDKRAPEKNQTPLNSNKTDSFWDRQTPRKKFW